MIQNILFNDKWLKEFSVIPLNFNTKEVQNYLKLAETIWLEPVIGRPLYDELLYQVKNNQLTDENSTLLVEAIYPYLGFCVAYEALPTLIYHVSEVSVTKGKSDNSEPIDLKETTYFEAHLRRQIEARKDYLIKWLDCHCDSFPLYQPSCNNSCCDAKGLNKPNPMFELYTPPRKNTTLR